MLGLIKKLKFQHINFKKQSVSKTERQENLVICMHFYIINQVTDAKIAHIQHDGA